MINQEIFRGKWREFKGGVRNVWGLLSDEEIERTKGNLSSLSGLIQTKYGETRDNVKQKLDRLLDSFDNDTDRGEDPDRTSYMRNPTEEEPTMDSNFDESNFSVGRDFKEVSRDFNSSSEAVGGSRNFGVGTGSVDESEDELSERYDSDEIFDSSRSDYGDDRVARH